MSALPQFVTEHAEDGADCPACGRWTKIYDHRTIHASMASQLIRLYRLAIDTEDGWVHVPSAIRNQGGDLVKARWWGLLVERPQRPGATRTSGYWHLTELGERYVLGQVTVPRWARVYGNELLGLHGPPRTVLDALGTRFDYRQLMDDA